MKRKIKFRAFDKRVKKMFFVNELKFREGVVSRVRLAVDNFPFIKGWMELKEGD